VVNVSRFDELIAAAWPAAVNEELEEWAFRAASGVTRRANSTLVRGETTNIETAVAQAEEFADRHAIPSVFLLSDRLAPASVMDVLRSRGYVSHARTAVLVRDLPMVPAPGRGVTTDVADGANDEWFNVYRSVESRADEAHGATVMRDTLLRPPHPAVFVAGRTEGCLVSVGQVVVSDGLGSVQCLATCPEGRRKGAARTVVDRLAIEAAALGAQQLVAAVAVANPASRALFDQAGFRESHHYEYAVRPSA
jgi:ribosomal protein S18 acetylase RimI-like enzyme